MATEMTRRTVSLPEPLEDAIVSLRKTDAFCRCSYSEIVRKLITEGLKTVSEQPDHIS